MKVNIVTRNIPSRRKSRQLKRYALKKMPRLERYIDPHRDTRPRRGWCFRRRSFETTRR